MGKTALKDTLMKKKHTALKRNVKNDTCIEFRRDVYLCRAADAAESGADVRCCPRCVVWSEAVQAGDTVIPALWLGAPSQLAARPAFRAARPAAFPPPRPLEGTLRDIGPVFSISKYFCGCGRGV